MRIFSSQGLDIKYKIEGSNGPVVLLLHGFGGGIHDWVDVVKSLEPSRRLILPSLKNFFTCKEPVSYGSQVKILSQFLSQACEELGVKSCRIAGHSCGATLGIGVRMVTRVTVDYQILFNPMPFSPLEKISDKNLKSLVQLAYMPGALKKFMSTMSGRNSLIELAKVFRIGSFENHEITHINERKLALVEKAFDRFVWIVKNESWQNWEALVKELKQEKLKNNFFVNDFYYSSNDPLFLEKDYLNLAGEIGAQRTVGIHHNGHLIVQDHAKIILPQLGL